MNAYDRRVLIGLGLQHDKYCKKLAQCELELTDTLFFDRNELEINQRIQRYNRILIRIENQMNLLQSKENNK